MKKLLKWMFIICTLGIGLIFWRWLFPKYDDKIKNYMIDDLMVHMFVGKKAIQKALEKAGLEIANHSADQFEDGRYGVVERSWITQKQYEFVKSSHIFCTRSACWRDRDSGWCSFN
jgi:hypothetical protein